MEMCMLTTTDNPYDPFTQYEAWYRFDEDNGYHSCAFLARIARTSDQLSDKENQEEIERHFMLQPSMIFHFGISIM